jgi:ABC-2 type transport system permease protein
VPRGLANLAQSLYPTSSKVQAEFQSEEKLKTIGDSHNPDDIHFANFKAKVLAQYNVSRIEDLPFNYNGLLMQEGERQTTQVYQEQQSKHSAQMLKQARFISRWMWLSPALALQTITTATSGNDLNHHLMFLSSAENRRYETIQYLNHLHMVEVRHENDKNQRLSAKFWQHAPRKLIELAPLNVSQSSLYSAFASLIASFILLFVVSFWVVKKQ